jgi:hypothetical protein
MGLHGAVNLPDDHTVAFLRCDPVKSRAVDAATVCIHLPALELHALVRDTTDLARHHLLRYPLAKRALTCGTHLCESDAGGRNIADHPVADDGSQHHGDYPDLRKGR